ncbi:MAG: Unknown protein [uncultured Sulfurovum sp.]|uniref:SPOR domain-containing protein n=1 Tax=uncultured Sulfurovum sp. TaxID=269237 RepID=A0A6S6SJZ8_9BACT|nr:MAG: Unknown protein [uncultured Sulfurovum sp.]
MIKTILLTTTLLLLLACETGVKNKGVTNETVSATNLNKNDNTRENYSVATQKSSNKIFSKSEQPGYYLQMAVFEKNKPNEAYLKPLADASLKHIVLSKWNKHYVLVGPYISYNSAKNQVLTVKSKLKKQTFVVQVLRP